MGRVCIVTDNTVQFSQPDFVSQKLVHIIPFEEQNRLGHRPAGFVYHAPSLQVFQNHLTRLHKTHAEILMITSSQTLSQSFLHATQAVQQMNGQARIQIVDSQSIGIGLGLIVQAAIEASLQGKTLNAIVRMVRSMAAHTFTLLCVPNLEVLYNNGRLSIEQTVAGSILNITPMFTIEDGTLTSLGKVRTQRQLFELMQEFLDEFHAPQQVALLKSPKESYSRSRALRQYANTRFPDTRLIESQHSPVVANLLGEESVGIVVIEENLP